MIFIQNLKNCLLLINIFLNSMFFLLYKQEKSVAISLVTLARLSIFLKQKLLNKQNFVKGKITKYECISFAIIFIILKLIYVKITLICKSERSFTKQILFFLYKKVLRKAGCSLLFLSSNQLNMLK